MHPLASRFLTPQNPVQRQYEALRAHCVDGLSLPDAAARFGYSPGSFRNLLALFRQAPDRPFFLSNPPGPKPSGSRPQGQLRDARILDLRRRRLSVSDIHARLRREGLPASEKTILKLLRAHGFGNLPRRSPAQLQQALRPLEAPAADRQLLDLSPRRFRTACGGLFLFLPLLARLQLDSLLQRCRLPGSKALPADCAFRSLLALKLWGVSRHSPAMEHVLDPGPALFAGLNVLPKRSSLTEYSCRVDPRCLPPLTRRWMTAAQTLGLPRGESFDLDFHTIPYHGDDALAQKHCVSKRSRQQKGLLALVARDAEARAFCYADATVRKQDRHQAPLRFAAYWKQLTGAYPAELVFDGGFTTQAVLGRIDALDIGFLTLQRRTRKLLRDLRARPAKLWRTIQLHSIGRQYRTPQVLEEWVRLGRYPKKVRRLAVAGLGREALLLLVTNQKRGGAATLVDRYARRMLIENQIADAIRFFHMDALSSAVPLKVDVDLQATLLAGSLYRLVATQLGRGHEQARAQTLFRKFVEAVARVQIEEQRIVVRFSRRANNPYLIAAGFADTEQPIPWLGNKALRLEFG